MSEENTSIAEILQFADENDCEVYAGAIICGGNGCPFEVQHDYGDANVSYWKTHDEARQEVARLWAAGQISSAHDFVVKAVSERIRKRTKEFDERASAYAEELKAELRAKHAA